MNLQNIKEQLNKNPTKIFDKLKIKYEVLGDNIYSVCPIHESSDNPRAFSYSINKNIWKCWTRDCQHQYRNDIFGLIQGVLSKQNGYEVNFAYVLKWIYSFLKFDNKMYLHNSVDIDNDDNFEKLVSIVKINKINHKHKSIELEELKYPSDYFLQRGFSQETLQHFEVGDCLNPDSKMYNRAIIPIHDDCGENVVGLIGRSIKEYKSPKFLIYPKGFNKGDFFYNYHRALHSINETKSVFIVEGQGDVWRLYEAGIQNAISIFGKTLSKEQEIKLSQLSLTHIIILTDNDQAGRESKIQLQRQLGRMYKLSFPKMYTKDIGEMSIEDVKNKILTQIKGLKA